MLRSSPPRLARGIGPEATRRSPARQVKTANWTIAAVEMTRMKAAISMFDLAQFAVWGRWGQ